MLEANIDCIVMQIATAVKTGDHSVPEYQLFLQDNMSLSQLTQDGSADMAIRVYMWVDGRLVLFVANVSDLSTR